MHKARELKIEIPDTELDTAYADARKDIPEDQFQQELTRRNLTPADMREGLRRELLADKVIEREVTSKVTITDQDVNDFYNANRAQFNRPEESYRIAQIVVTPSREPQRVNRSGNDAGTPQEAAAKAQMLMERLKQGAAVQRAGRRLLRGSAVGAARRRPRLRAAVGAAEGAAAAARRGAQGPARAP